MSGNERNIRERLYETLAAVRDPEEVAAVLPELFTAGQIDEAARRLDIAARLKRGMGVRLIAQRLQVSTKTVSRVNKKVFQRPFKLAFQRWEEWLLRAED